MATIIVNGARHEVQDDTLLLYIPRNADRTAATRARKTKRSFCRRPSASPCACNGCGPEDFQWSTPSPAAYSDVEIGLDANGKMIAYRIDHFMPAMQDDRPIGAVLAGLPTRAAPSEKGAFVGSPVNELSDPRLYDGVATLMERGQGTFQLGRKESPLAIGMRDHSMRTPGQYQQNFPRELAVSEAAAPAGADAIQFRIDHAREERAIGVLKAVRETSGWETRPSPRARAVSTGNTSLRGRGVR
jgi:nicotinate dehydrogenase subunit B